MLEPYEGKLSRTVLRGEGDSNTTDLPDQLIENKQRFISQIMTSKTPVREAEDVDEVTLSYSEVKALATGNPLVKEKMEIENDIEKIKIAKANYLAAHTRLEHKIREYYPQRIQELTGLIKNVTHDQETVQERDMPFEIELNGKRYIDPQEAGKIIAASVSEFLPLNGQYRGMKFQKMTHENYQHPVLMFYDQLKYIIETSLLGSVNLTRLQNLPNIIHERLTLYKEQLEMEKSAFESAKIEIEKPFMLEEELHHKSCRLKELELLLSVEKDKFEEIKIEQACRMNYIVDAKPEKSSKDVEDIFVLWAKEKVSSNEVKWKAEYDMEIGRKLIKKGFDKNDVLRTIIKLSPSVAGKEEIERGLTQAAAASR